MADTAIHRSSSRRNGEKSPDAFRTISEVAGELDLPQHVLRFWESKFPQIRPMKRSGGRRYYRPEDLTLLKRIRALLYDDGYTIKGVQKLFSANGVKSVVNSGEELPSKPDNCKAETQGELAFADPKRAELSLLLEDLESLRRITRENRE